TTNETATTHIYTLSLHDALPILIGITFMVKWWSKGEDLMIFETGNGENIEFVLDDGTHINLNANSRLVWNNRWEQEGIRSVTLRSEEHTSELQSRENLVCRLLLE